MELLIHDVNCVWQNALLEDYVCSNQNKLRIKFNWITKYNINKFPMPLGY